MLLHRLQRPGRPTGMSMFNLKRKDGKRKANRPAFLLKLPNPSAGTGIAYNVLPIKMIIIIKG